jgi:hypothetical protein
MYYWTSFYNFNPQSGDIIQLEDLFTETGYKNFKWQIKQGRIEQLKTDFPNGIPDELDYIVEAYEKSDLKDFYIKDNAIFIDSDNCFYKNQKFCGAKMVYRFELAKFEMYLNNYGKVLFGLADNSSHYGNYLPSSLPALYSGNIGEWPIQFYLDRKSIYSDQIHATYLYAKYGKGIRVSGTFEDGQIHLIEKDENYAERAEITAQIKDDRISGTWRSLVSEQSYPFEVIRE